MDEQRLMAAVRADPKCPVKLQDPEAYPPRQWPRIRVEPPPQFYEVYYRVCECRGARLDARGEEPARPGPRPVVELKPRKLGVATDRGQRAAWVYLGQCGDCGRIYWCVLPAC